MQNLIDRLKIVRQNITTDELNLIAVDEELAAIIQGLETLDLEHTRQTNDLRGLREITSIIRQVVQHDRRQHNIWQDEITSLDDDVSSLLTELGKRLVDATDDAASLRGLLEDIRNTARKAETDDDLTPTHRHARFRDLLDSVGHRAASGLSVLTGAELRKDIREMESLVDAFEKSMQETGGYRYSNDRTLSTRVQRCVDHYTRMASRAVSDSHTFKDGTVSWLRGVAINAQSVSWATTHHEKDARLRGLIEVIETAISKIDEFRLDDRLSSWNGVVDSWMKSDYPTREMRRRILDQQEEIERLKRAVGETAEAVADTPDY